MIILTTSKMKSERCLTKHEDCNSSNLQFRLCSVKKGHHCHFGDDEGTWLVHNQETTSSRVLSKALSWQVVSWGSLKSLLQASCNEAQFNLFLRAAHTPLLKQVLWPLFTKQAMYMYTIKYALQRKKRKINQVSITLLHSSNCQWKFSC